MIASRIRAFILMVLVFLTLAACQGAGGEAREDAATLALPTLTAREAGDEPLRVVATTSMIGEAASRVGGEAIVLSTLMAPGQDPHSYEPSTADLTGVAQADVILVNGWNLEEGLVDDLANIAGDTPLAPVSAGVEPVFSGEEGSEAEDEEHEGEEEHTHAGPDPHVWLDPANVQQWVRNIETVFSALDPGNAQRYTANAAAYLEELAALEAYMEAELAQIAPERRRLVTNHDALAYFARRFDFEVVGTVIPAASTLAEPSAQSMAGLVEKMQQEGVCTIFAETTANARLAETVAAELSSCDSVHVLPLYTGALGAAGSGAETYVEMMRLNTEMLVKGLADSG